MKKVAVTTVATVALLGTGLAWPATTSVATDAPDAPTARHAGGLSSARVMEGTSMWKDPTHLTRKQAAALKARQQRVLDRSGLAVTDRPNGSVSIPIDFHGITDRQGHGFVSLERIHRQIRVLNRAYGGRTGPAAANTPFRFHLESVTRTKSNRWYNASYFSDTGPAKYREMRRALHVGNARHLNMYTVGPNFGLLGFATYPAGYAKLDGMVLLNGSLPGGNANFGPGSVYNQGDTATHEVGHWLNVRHTFERGCSPLNDLVTDTPRQDDGANIFEEDVTLNTCGRPNGPTRDPVRNFMNYTHDPFMNQFTFGQRDRMNSAWFIRRALAASD